MVTEKEKLQKSLDEIINAKSVLDKHKNCICVFGSSAIKAGTKYYEDAVLTGEKLALAGFEVITGGGPGIMEAVNKGVQNAKGKSIGICMEFPDICIQNDFIDKENHLLLTDMAARKYLFWKYAKAFIALPGGLGTLDEITECLTLMQMGNIEKRPLILQDKTFWQPMTDWLKNTLKNDYKTIKQSDIDLFTLSDSPEETIQRIINA
ncbi:MAG: TIGR00730 family Rossman fold protein [Bacteroidales bacterium]|jgi:uncharacterized protein (TIGR00730 family)|nr:TIGR00730 family Rossman fold protein [Bacteroidales bacterium]